MGDVQRRGRRLNVEEKEYIDNVGDGNGNGSPNKNKLRWHL